MYRFAIVIRLLPLLPALIAALQISAYAQDYKTSSQGTADSSSDGEPGYCRWVKGASDSDRFILMYPEIYSTVGPTASNSSGDENGIDKNLALRLTVGLQYRFIGLYQGIVTGSYSEARCRRYRIQNKLQIALEIGRDLGRIEALEAKAAVIAAALPEAEEQLAKLYEKLENNVATVNELYSMQLKLDNLRDMAGQTQFELERIRRLPSPPAESLDNLIRNYNDLDDQIENYEGRLRRSKAWALDIKGGYDQSFGNEKAYPLFAQVLLSFNFGGFGQPEADRRSAEGRRAWRGESVETIQSSIEDLKYNLIGVEKAERKRLAELTKLAAELAERLKKLDSLKTENSRRFRNSMWLDYIRLDAERTYLEKHLESLQKISAGRIEKEE